MAFVPTSGQPQLAGHWGQNAALLGCIFWPGAAVFLQVAGRGLWGSATRRIGLYYALTVPFAAAAWALWGNAEILAPYAICVAVNTGTLCAALMYKRLGLVTRSSLFTPAKAHARPLTSRSSWIYKFWCWLHVLVLAFFVLAGALVHVFAKRHGFMVQPGLWDSVWNIIAIMGFFTLVQFWHALEDNYDAKPGTRAMPYAAGALPAILAYGLALSALPSPSTHMMMGGVFGFTVSMLIMAAVKKRDT